MFRAVTAGLNPIRSDVVLAVKEAKTATLALLKDKYHTLCAADHIKTPFRDLRAKAVRARKAPSFRASFTPSRLQNSSKNSLVHLVVQARLRITDTSSFMRAPTTLMSSPSHIQKRHLHSSSPLILSPQTSPKETQDTLEDASDKSDTTKNTKSTESQVYQKLHVPKTDMQWFIFFHNVLQGSSLLRT